MPHLDGPGDVLDHLLTTVTPCDVETVPYLPISIVRNADAAWVRKRFDACCDIDAVSKNIIAIYHHITEVNTNSVQHLLLIRLLGVALSHQCLKLYGAGNGLHDAGKFKQLPISSRPDEAATMILTNGISSRAVLL